MKETKDEVKKIIRSLLISAKHGLTINQLCSEYTAINCKSLPYKELGYFSAVDLVKDMPDVVQPMFLPGGVLLLKGVADSSTAHINALVSRQRTTGHNSRIVSAQHITKPITKIVPNFIRSKILDLMTLYPKGIQLHMFEKMYQNVHGQKLIPERIGFNSIRAVLIECPDIVAIKLGVDGPFVYPVQSEDTDTNATEKTHCKPKIGISSNLKHEICAVLKRRRNGIWTARFPFEYKELHKKDFDIQKLGFNNIIELMVKLEGDVFISRPVPYGDWILFAKEYGCFYHNRKNTDKFRLKRDTVKTNQVCCALYEDGNWYRAIIKNVLPYERAQVFYVDYGNEVTIEVSSLRILDKQFLSLPCQALQAKLYGAMPDEGNTWSKEAVEHFYELTSDRHLYAKVMDKRDVLLVHLIDTNGKEDIDVADEMRSKMNPSMNVMTVSEPAVQVDQPSEFRAEKLHQFYSEYYQTLKHVSRLTQCQQLGTDIVEAIQNSQQEGMRTSREDEIQTVEREQQKCQLKRVTICDNIYLHLFRYKGKAYVTSAEISRLFWDADILRQMIRQRALQMERELLLCEDNKELFDLLVRNKVYGISSGDGNIRTFVAIYLFSRLPILFENFKCKYNECQQTVRSEISKLEMFPDEYWSFSEECHFEENYEKEKLRLQALKFKRKRLYLTMMTNCATTSTIHDLQVLEKQISCIETLLSSG